MAMLKVIYHPIYSLDKFVTSKSKLPLDGAQLFILNRVIGHHVIHVRALM